MRQQTIITGGAIYSKVCFRESVVSRRDPWDACISDSKIVKRDLIREFLCAERLTKSEILFEYI